MKGSMGTRYCVEHAWDSSFCQNRTSPLSSALTNRSVSIARMQVTIPLCPGKVAEIPLSPSVYDNGHHQDWIKQKKPKRTISQSEIRLDDPDNTIPSDVTSTAPGCRLVDAAMYAVDMFIEKEKGRKLAPEQARLKLDQSPPCSEMAILGIGADIVYIPRFLALIQRRSPSALARRILSQPELEDWNTTRSDHARFLAVRYVDGRSHPIYICLIPI